MEVKSASLAWHYRGSPRDFGMRQAHELRLLLGDLLSNQPLEVLEGKKVIEVRWRGVSKRVVAQRVAAETGSGTIIVAIGDDRTDEELFRALPSCSVTVAVSRPITTAAFRLDDHRAVRRILRLLVADQGVVKDGRTTHTRTKQYPHEHAQPLEPTMSYALHAIVGLLHIWPLVPGLSALRDGRSQMRRVVLPRVSARWLLEFEIASGKRPPE